MLPHIKHFNGMQRLLRESQKPDKVVVVPKTFTFDNTHRLIFNKTFTFDTQSTYLSPTEGRSEPCSWAADVGAPLESSVFTNTYVESKRFLEELTNTHDFEIIEFQRCVSDFSNNIFLLSGPCTTETSTFNIIDVDHRSGTNTQSEETANDFFEDMQIGLECFATLQLSLNLSECAHVWRMSRRVWQNLRNRCESNPFRCSRLLTSLMMNVASTITWAIGDLVGSLPFPVQVLFLVTVSHSLVSFINMLTIRMLFCIKTLVSPSDSMSETVKQLKILRSSRNLLIFCVSCHYIHLLLALVVYYVYRYSTEIEYIVLVLLYSGQSLHSLRILFASIKSPIQRPTEDPKTPNIPESEEVETRCHFNAGTRKSTTSSVDPTSSDTPAPTERAAGIAASSHATRSVTDRAAFQNKVATAEALRSSQEAKRLAEGSAKSPNVPSPLTEAGERDVDHREDDGFSPPHKSRHTSGDPGSGPDENDEGDEGDDEDDVTSSEEKAEVVKRRRESPKRAQKSRKRRRPGREGSASATFTADQLTTILQVTRHSKGSRRPKSVMGAFKEGEEQLDEFLKHFTTHIQTYDLKANSPRNMEEIYSNLRPLIKKTETTHLLEEALAKTKNERGDWNAFVNNFLDKAYPPNYHKHVRDTVAQITQKRDEKSSAFLVRITSEAGKIPETSSLHYRQVDIKDLFIRQVRDAELVRHLILKSDKRLQTTEQITTLIRKYEKAISFGGVTKNQGDAPRDAPRETPREAPRDFRRDNRRDNQYRAAEDRDRQPSPSPRNENPNRRRERDDSKPDSFRGNSQKCSFCQESITNKREHQRVCKYGQSKDMLCGFCNQEVSKKDKEHMLNCPKIYCRPCERKGEDSKHSWHKCKYTLCRICHEIGHSTYFCTNPRKAQEEKSGDTERSDHLQRSIRTHTRGGAPFCPECEQTYIGDASTHDEVCHSLNHEYYVFGDCDSEVGEDEQITYSHAKNVGCGNCLARSFECLDDIRVEQLKDPYLRAILEKADNQLDADPSQLSYTDTTRGWRVKFLRPRVVTNLIVDQVMCTETMYKRIFNCFFYSPHCPVWLRDQEDGACFNPTRERYDLITISLQIASRYFWDDFEETVRDALKEYEDTLQVGDPSHYLFFTRNYMVDWLKKIRSSIRCDLYLNDLESDNSYETSQRALKELKKEAVASVTNLSPDEAVRLRELGGSRSYVMEIWNISIAKLVTRLLETLHRGVFKENVKFFLFETLSFLTEVPSALIDRYMDMDDHLQGFNLVQLYRDKCVHLFVSALLREPRYLASYVPADRPVNIDLNALRETIAVTIRNLTNFQPQTYARQWGWCAENDTFVFSNAIEGSTNNILKAFFTGLLSRSMTIGIAKVALASRLWIYDRALPSHYVLIELYMLAFYNGEPINIYTQTCYCPGCDFQGTFEEVKNDLEAFVYTSQGRFATPEHPLVESNRWSIQELMVPFFNNSKVPHRNEEGRSNLRFRSSVVVPSPSKLRQGELWREEPESTPSEMDDTFAIWCILENKKPRNPRAFNPSRRRPSVGRIRGVPQSRPALNPTHPPPVSPTSTASESPLYSPCSTPPSSPSESPLYSPCSTPPSSPVRSSNVNPRSPQAWTDAPTPPTLTRLRTLLVPPPQPPNDPVRRPDGQAIIPEAVNRVNTRAASKRARELQDTTGSVTTRSHDSNAGMVGDDVKQSPKPLIAPPPRTILSLEKISECFELATHVTLKVALVTKKTLTVGTSFPYIGNFISLITKNFAPEVQALGPILGGFCVLADPSTQTPGYIEQTTTLEPVVEVTVSDIDTDLVCSVGLGGEGLFAYMDRSRDYEMCNAIVVHVNEPYPRIQLTRTLIKGELIRLFQHSQIAGVPNTSGTTCWFSCFLHMYGDLNLHELLRDSKSAVVRLISKFVREMETFKYRDEDSTIVALDSIFSLLGQFIKGGIKTTFDLAEFWHIFFGTILPETDLEKVKHCLTTVQTSVICIHCDTVKINSKPTVSLPMCHLNVKEEGEDFNDLMKTLPKMSRLNSERYCPKCKKQTKENELISYNFGDMTVISIPRKISTKNIKTGESHTKKLHNQVFVEPMTEFHYKQSEHQYILSGVVLHQRNAHFQTDTISSSYTAIDGGHYTYARFAQLTDGKQMNYFNDAIVTTKSLEDILVRCSRKVVFVVLRKAKWTLVNGSPVAMIISPSVEEKKSSTSSVPPPLALGKSVVGSEEKEDCWVTNFSKSKTIQDPSLSGLSTSQQLQKAYESKQAAETLLNTVWTQVLLERQESTSPASILEKND